MAPDLVLIAVLYMLFACFAVGSFLLLLLRALKHEARSQRRWMIAGLVLLIGSFIFLVADFIRNGTSSSLLFSTLAGGLLIILLIGLSLSELIRLRRRGRE